MSKKKIIQPEENLNNSEKQNTLKVEIISNWSFLEILSDWRKVSKIVLALFVIVITIFIGLAIVTLSIKRIYPYNDIKINTFGATTMQNEETDVIYWLFNTADLWANSGIQVKKGDRLTIRASGKSHTAIHHLVEDATKNEKLRDKWVGTDGEEKKEPRDVLRGNFRIFPNKAQDALLMQVVPNDKEHYLTDKPDENDPDKAAKFRAKRDKYLVFEDNYDEKEIDPSKNFYYIGKERADLLIYNDGVLHFAVNDIVLTDSIINRMKKANDSLIRDTLKLKQEDSISEKDWRIWNKEYFKFGKHPTDTTKTEMDFYEDMHYYNAWYDDNVGSFLIVIERKRSK
jgi:hypothetical protein